MLIHPILELYRLRKQQWLNIEEINSIQFRKLIRILKHSFENVSYYQQLFHSCGLTPEDIKSVEELSKIPITTRLELQKLPPEEIVAKNIDLKKCKKITTAGSTGTPLVVYQHKKDSLFYDMVWARTSLENGKRLWDRTAYFKFHFPPKFWFERLGIWRKELISLLDSPEEQIDSLRRVKPEIIRGNAFQLVNLARVIKEKAIKDINPRLVFSMGSLLDSEARSLIESSFKAEVFDCYGATELGCIAWECSEHKGYHINIDTVVVEFVKDGKVVGPEEMARIVCTGLHSYSMPFIRYDIGDIGILSEEKCSCGRGLPLLKSLEGRADDFFVSSDGALHSPSVIVNQIKLIPGISQFRMVQEQKKKILAFVVPNEGFSQDAIKNVKQTMQKIMGEELFVEVVTLDEIPPDPSGKIRSLISNVKGLS